MDLLRRRVLRAASLIFLLGALAAPVHAADAPIIYWTPDGFGDPDPGGTGVDYFRHLKHVLLLSGRVLLTPTAPIITPGILQPVPRVDRIKR